MKERKVTRYIAECGRGFWSKKACLYHEEVCQCFKDCDCMDEWIKQGNPKRIEEYTLFDGKRNRRYKTIENALIKMNEINNK